MPIPPVESSRVHSISVVIHAVCWTEIGCTPDSPTCGACQGVGQEGAVSADRWRSVCAMAGTVVCGLAATGGAR